MQTNTRTCTRYFNRPVIIVPSDNIRLCKKPLNGTTTTGSSYIYHGGYRPVCNFKPKSNYVRSEAVSASDTTHKLSYQPFPIERREKLPWAQKKVYRPPETGLETFTTYSQSYIPIDGVHKEKPIKPLQNSEWLGRKYNFNGTSSYNEAFIPLPIEHVVPQIPSGNIVLSNDLMESETTSKLSYQKFNVQKRLPIKPRAKNTRYEGPMQTLTTNRIDYQPKVTSRPEIKIPRDNIRNSDKPIEGLTTSASSYLYYGPINLTQSFKPVKNYQKPVGKFDDITINKLSYRPWDPVIRENYPWAQKPKYKKPTRPIDDNSIYKISFIPPEYYCYQQCEGPSCPRLPTTSQNVMCLN
ncbi:stabilizer of axonemal microtubules 2-like [Microplitis mediator]|uniref:stabilizer of axonemal microtubules 2-like n=1 Tax=Microplitis mediator TaxID=375433 RepID=UPI0025527539|nr:stabilizer of axonemal microtubules 2-like [Microplitis mediator]